MATRRDELTRTAARLFAEHGFHGTSMGDLAEAMGVQKGSLYSLTGSKQELLLRDDARGRARVPRGARRRPRGRACGRADPARAARRTFASSPTSSTSRPCSPASGATSRASAREQFVAERRRYEERCAALFREGVERGELRTDLDVGAAALLVLSAANWAYTWLAPGRDTDELADRFAAILLDGVRGYSTR